MSGDEISLTLPADDAFHRVAHLVVGGLAVRLDLSFENLEDLEIALDTLLARSGDDGELTVRVRVLDDELQTVVGPFRSLSSELEEPGDESLTLRRILDAVCDRVDITERDGGQWVELTKRVSPRKGASA